MHCGAQGESTATSRAKLNAERKIQIVRIVECIRMRAIVFNLSVMANMATKDTS
jgi:hypothetical protein